jgi:hypothetical protein
MKSFTIGDYKLLINTESYVAELLFNDFSIQATQCGSEEETMELANALYKAAFVSNKFKGDRI